MKILNLTFIVILCALVSCSENKKTSAPQTPSSEMQQAENKKDSITNSVTPAEPAVPDSVSQKAINDSGDSIMRLSISFYSIGEGIDRGQKEKLLSYLEDFEKKDGKKIEYSEVHWGREGETDFCFPLKGFSDKQVTDFIKGAKAALNTAEHVHFAENQPCRKGR